MKKRIGKIVNNHQFQLIHAAIAGFLLAKSFGPFNAYFSLAFLIWVLPLGLALNFLSSWTIEDTVEPVES